MKLLQLSLLPALLAQAMGQESSPTTNLFRSNRQEPSQPTRRQQTVLVQKPDGTRVRIQPGQRIIPSVAGSSGSLKKRKGANDGGDKQSLRPNQPVILQKPDGSRVLVYPDQLPPGAVRVSSGSTGGKKTVKTVRGRGNGGSTRPRVNGTPPQSPQPSIVSPNSRVLIQPPRAKTTQRTLTRTPVTTWPGSRNPNRPATRSGVQPAPTRTVATQPFNPISPTSLKIATQPAVKRIRITAPPPTAPRPVTRAPIIRRPAPRTQPVIHVAPTEAAVPHPSLISSRSQRPQTSSFVYPDGTPAQLTPAQENQIALESSGRNPFLSRYGGVHLRKPYPENYCDFKTWPDDALAGIRLERVEHFIGNASCSEIFFECAIGQTFQTNCRGNQVFDVTTGNCNYRYNVKTCPGYDHVLHCTIKSQCTAGEFACCASPQKCIPISARCDGQADCMDGEDENNCPACAANELPCVKSGQCIPWEKKCDGVPDDCFDQSNYDEAECQGGCALDQFHCKRSDRGAFGPACMNMSVRCNGVVECPNGEDELNCKGKGPKHLLCEDQRKSVPKAQWCDGNPDCDDGSDEFYCQW